MSEPMTDEEGVKPVGGITIGTFGPEWKEARTLRSELLQAQYTNEMQAGVILALEEDNALLRARVEKLETVLGERYLPEGASLTGVTVHFDGEEENDE